MLQEILSFISEDEFLNLRSSIVNYAIEEIKNSEKFEEFKKSDFSHDLIYNLPTTKLYYPENHKKGFVSLDMKNANFQILSKYADIIPDNSYYDFIKYIALKLHADTHIPYNLDFSLLMDYFENAKSMRQYIFGNCNPKKQQQAQNYIINNIGKTIQDKLGVPVYKLSSDELIIAEENAEDMDCTAEIDAYPFDFEMQPFVLHKVVDGRDIYVRENIGLDAVTESYDIVGCPKYLYPQYYASLFDDVILPSDLYFCQDKNIARFNTIDYPLQNNFRYLNIDDNNLDLDEVPDHVKYELFRKDEVWSKIEWMI
jgi:hypothetical protein